LLEKEKQPKETKEEKERKKKRKKKNYAHRGVGRKASLLYADSITDRWYPVGKERDGWGRKKIAGRIDGRGSRRGETNYLHVLFTADS
jgi:hypothetical protein